MSAATPATESTIGSLNGTITSLPEMATNLTTMPRWCLFEMDRTFWRMCDLDLKWGVIAEGCAGLGILLTTIAFAFYLSSVKYVVRHQASKNIYLLIFTFIGCFLSFVGSLAFVLEPNFIVCNVRRVLLSMSWTFIHAPILVLCTVTWAEPFLDEIRFCSVMLSTVSFILVEAIIVAQWSILRPVLDGGLCELSVYTYPSSMAFNYFVTFLIIVSSIVAYQNIKKKHATENPDELGVMFPTLFMACTTVPNLAAWAFMMIFGLPELDKVKVWYEPANAFFMITTTLLVLVFYVLPVLVNMNSIKKDEIVDVEADNDLPNMVPDVIERPIPMVGLHPYDRSALDNNVGHQRGGTNQNGTNHGVTNGRPITFQPTPATRQQSCEVTRVNRLRSPTGSKGAKNNGHCNVTLELHEEDVMWKNGR